MIMDKNQKYECWVDEKNQILSFHNVKDYIIIIFNSYYDFFSFVIKNCQKGYKVQ